MTNASRAHALIQGRDAVYPEDLQSVFPSIVKHRLTSKTATHAHDDDTIAQQILDAVAIP